MFDQTLHDQAAALLQACRDKHWRIATAESCTGGLIAGCLTAIPGSSDVVDRGFITYSNSAKTDMLGVPAALIAEHGAVSAAVAEAMAMGALARSDAQLAVAVTGVAGPDGGTETKPVGLVWFGLAMKDQPPRSLECRFGDLGRTTIRSRSVAEALILMAEAVDAPVLATA